MTGSLPSRLAVLIESGRYQLLETEEIFFVEASGHHCRVRTRSKRPRVVHEPLAELEARLSGTALVRCHRSFLVNLDRVRELRRQEDGGWELKMEPPVNAIVPVGRSWLGALRERLGLA